MFSGNCKIKIDYSVINVSLVIVKLKYLFFVISNYFKFIKPVSVKCFSGYFKLKDLFLVTHVSLGIVKLKICFFYKCLVVIVKL